MNIIIAIVTIINLLVYIYIWTSVLRKWGVSKAHRRFFFLTLFSFLWVLIVYVQDELFAINIHSFLVHLNFAVAALVAGFVFSFAIHFPKQNTKIIVLGTYFWRFLVNLFRQVLIRCFII